MNILVADISVESMPVADKRRKKKTVSPSQEFINWICSLYNDVYDDREEDSSIGGEDWVPGEKALHTSLRAFQKELNDMGIELSTAKLRKILITGGRWTTERSREVAELYDKYHSISRVASELRVSTALVTMYLLYISSNKHRLHGVSAPP